MEELEHALWPAVEQDSELQHEHNFSRDGGEQYLAYRRCMVPDRLYVYCMHIVPSFMLCQHAIQAYNLIPKLRISL